MDFKLIPSPCRSAFTGMAGPGTPRRRLAEALECHIRFQQFTDETGPRVPLSLPCGHCFCKECLLRLPSTRFPDCSSDFPASVDSIPKNFALLHVLEVTVTIPLPKPVVPRGPEEEENAQAQVQAQMVQRPRKRSRKIPPLKALRRPPLVQLCLPTTLLRVLPILPILPVPHL